MYDHNPWSNPSLYMRAAARQANGKFLFGGYCLNCPDSYRAVVLRVNIDGDPDATFGDGGWSSVPMPQQPRLDQLQVDAQARIVIAGGTIDGGLVFPLVARLTPSGAADPSFGDGNGYVKVLDLPDTANGGWVVTAMSIARDGSMVLAASNYTPIDVARTELFRLDASGARDTTFGSSGLLDLTLENGSRIESLVQRSDRTLIVAGWIAHTGGGHDFLVARALPDGSLDDSFDGNGLVRIAMTTNTDEAEAMMLAAGRPVIAGFGIVPGGHTDAAVLRLKSDLIFSDGVD